MAATAEQIKKLREETGAGVLEAKKTLDANNGDYDKALSILKAKGLAGAAKKAERVAKEGLIATYVHGAGKVGVMVEVNCETDFVARTNEFQQLAHNLALQIAAASPQFVAVENIPAETLEAQKKTFDAAARAEGKPAHVVERIVQGKLDKYYGEVVLLRQPFIKDDSMTIEDLIKATIAKTGENIVVRRFTRYALGE